MVYSRFQYHTTQMFLKIFPCIKMSCLCSPLKSAIRKCMKVISQTDNGRVHLPTWRLRPPLQHAIRKTLTVFCVATQFQIQNWWQPQAQRRSRIPLPGRPVLVRVAAFRPKTTSFLQLAKLSAADECKQQQQQTVILWTNPRSVLSNRVKHKKKKNTDFSPFFSTVLCRRRSLATVRRTVRAVCESAVFLSRNTHTHAHVSIVQNQKEEEDLSSVITQSAWCWKKGREKKVFYKW